MTRSSRTQIKRLYQMGGTMKLNATSNSLTKGLVGWWTFDGKDVSGVQAYDRSGSGNRGILTNGPTLVNGRIGQGMGFDGVNDWVNLLSDSARPPNVSTVSMWVFPKTGSDSSLPMLISSDRNVSIGIEYDYPTSKFQFDILTTNDVFSRNASSFTSALNTWHHIVWSYDGTFLRGYVDGVLGVAVAKTGNLLYSGSATDAFSLGAFCDNGPACSNFFPSLIDDVRIYNRALSKDEIKRLYNIGR